MDEIKVLLVEDNPVDEFMVRAALERSTSAAFTVSSAERLDAAIKQARSSPTDVMLLDLGLPDVQGMQTFVRARDALPNLPILVLSGHDDEQFAIQSMQQGAQDYLLKGNSMKNEPSVTPSNAIAPRRRRKVPPSTCGERRQRRRNARC